MLIDPLVGQLVSPSITADMANDFQKLYAKGNSSITFREVYDQSPPGLKMYLPSYINKSICDSYEQEGQFVLGVNGEGDCVYWSQGPAPLSWECLNDGTCAQSLNGKYLDEDSCNSNCG